MPTRANHEITPLYVNLHDLAQMFSVSVRTLMRLIAEGKLNHERGLRKVTTRYRVEVAPFKAAFDRGDFNAPRSQNSQ